MIKQTNIQYPKHTNNQKDGNVSDNIRHLIKTRESKFDTYLAQLNQPNKHIT